MEKLKAYEALVKEFEDSGLATDGGAISEYYNQLVELKNQYKEIAENNKKIQDDYDNLDKKDSGGNGQGAGVWRNKEYTEQQRRNSPCKLKAAALILPEVVQEPQTVFQIKPKQQMRKEQVMIKETLI